jgi:predicted amidohydrolase
MQDLRISLVQTDLHWHNPEANRAMLEEKIWNHNLQTDVIILPEMFTTGFTMEAEKWAEPMNLHTFKWMRQMASQTGALLLGSIIVKNGGRYVNRLLWLQPDGLFHFYDKRHLFRMANEDRYYSKGDERLIGSWKGWKICPLICYDLRFPVWSRNVGLEYDLLVYVANWPELRITAWDALLRARAIENLAYVAGVNRVGLDGKGIPYVGHSAVIDPKGLYLLPPQHADTIFNITLSGEELLKFREKFPAQLDADEFELKP